MPTDEKYLSKIAALLRLAESAGTAEEAANAMSKAQQIASATSISLEVARQHQADKEKREAPIQKRVQIGPRGQKGLKYYVNLFMGIGEVNDVKFNIAHNSTYVIAFGFPSDIEMTELLYASLITQMVESSNKFIKSGEYKNEFVRAPVYESYYDSWEGKRVRTVVDYKEKPVDGRVARANFQQAFVSKITQRLWTARNEAVAEVEAERDKEFNSVENTEATTTGTELVLFNKKVEVRDFYKATSTAKGSWKGGSSSTAYSSNSRSAGSTAGARAKIGTQSAIGGGRTALGG